jgi:trk system potassium uptake protein TrkH
MDAADDRAAASSGVRARASRARNPGERVAAAVRLALAVVGAAAVIVEFGFHVPEGERHVARLVVWGVLAGYAVLSWFDAWRGGASRDAARAERWIALAGALVGWWMPGAAVCATLLLLVRLWSGYIWVLGKGVNPGLVFVGSFATLIAGGTGLLMLPAATPEGKEFRLVDALFTATSAGCVTGLVVRDTGTDLTRFGQTVVMILFQLGGLGTVLFGGIVALMLGSSLSLRAVHALSDSAAGGLRGVAGIRRLVLFSGGAVVVTELIGAACLFLGWPDTWEGAPQGLTHWPDRAFHAVFFSVSAFCNAGFATCATSLHGLRAHWTSHVVIAGLIVVGGIGLPVLVNAAQIGRSWVRRRVMGERRMPVRLTLHSKLVLATTATVYLLGAGLILVGQTTQAGLAPGQALLDAHFMSISTRTAGFETVAPAEMGMLSRMSMVVTMFIGGSPGSTAGGLKTVSFAVLFLVVWSAMMDREGVRAFGRSIPMEIISKAATLLVLHAVLCLGVAAALCVTEGAERGVEPGGISAYEQYVFESASACSTVGLSMGITPTLSDAGKLVVAAGMFFGRVGSLALLVSLAGIARRTRARYAYPSEGVVLS